MDKQVAHVASGEYSQDFAQIIQIIEQNRSQAIQVINHASVLTAWQVGAYVSDKIKNAAWGSKVVQQLEEYIHTQNPTLKGWSKRTIYKMVQFYETYTSAAFMDLSEKFKHHKQFVPFETAQFVSPEMTQIVSTPLIQNGYNVIVSPAVTQIKSSSIVPISSAQIPMQAAVVPNYDIVQVRVPHIELRRFKTIVKALGCMVETLSPIERSLREAESGEILHYESLDDLIKEIG